MSYGRARQQLIAHGFTPMAFKHTAQGRPMGLNDALVQTFPEVTLCSGTGHNPCTFVFRSPKPNEPTLAVVTLGEVMDSPAADLGVMGIFVNTTQYATTADLTDPVAETTDENLLTPFTSWRFDKAGTALDALNEGPDTVSAELGGVTYAVDGKALVSALRRRGYRPASFYREDNDYEKVDFVGAAPGDIIRIYFQPNDAGSAIFLSNIAVGGKKLTDAEALSYLAAQLGHPLRKFAG